MKIIDTEISDVKIIAPSVYGDERGFFLETYQKQKYLDVIGDVEFVQDNHSQSSKGVLRGLHFQINNPQGKLVRCVRGEVFDVVVDIRKNSPTYKQWVGVYLNEQNKRQLWCPPNLAHGFLVVSDVADFEYKCTDYYNPNDEGCLMWDDDEVNITWPKLDVDYIISSKDQKGLSLGKL